MYAIFQFNARAVLGIEPRTSRTRSENHATRPNSHVSLSILPGSNGTGESCGNAQSLRSDPSRDGEQEQCCQSGTGCHVSVTS